MNIKRVIKESYEQLYAHKFDNLDETDQLLERHTYQNSSKDKYSHMMLNSGDTF